jgi:hypothetical protein
MPTRKQPARTARAAQPERDLPAELAERLAEALHRQRIVPRFVDSYVVEHGRFGLQVHAALYRDLLYLLQREALLAMTVRALELVAAETLAPQKSKKRAAARDAGFRRTFLSALAHRQRWTAGDALEFQKGLRMYEDLVAAAAPKRRNRKPFDTTNHPFVDRCAFLLDTSFLERARVAATRALNEIERLTAQVAETVLHPRGQTPAP